MNYDTSFQLFSSSYILFEAASQSALDHCPRDTSDTMKAADYRIPWGRPSEHLLAVKREIVGQQMHLQRIHDARNRSTIDTEPPECAHMPHLVTRLKKQKVQ